MGRRAKVRAGMIIKSGPRQPAEGSQPSFNANSSTSIGANQYSGIATPVCVRIAIRLSSHLPGFNPDSTPRGIEIRMENKSAINDKVRVTF